MHIRTVRWLCDNGRRVSFSAGEYMLRSLHDTLGSQSQTIKAPGQDGATTYSVTLGQPVISVSGLIQAAGNPMEEVQRKLFDMCDALKWAFMPNQFGLLIDERGNAPRQIRCHAIETPAFGKRFGNVIPVTIELIADSPYWESAHGERLHLGEETGAFRFPLRFPTIMGTYYRRGAIDNTTPLDVWPTVEIYTASEYVALRNDTTGKIIRIDHSLLAGQKLIINTAAATCEVWQQSASGEWEFADDVSFWLSGDSEWWPLVPGQNVISLENEVVDGSVVATVSYRLPM